MLLCNTKDVKTPILKKKYPKEKKVRTFGKKFIDSAEVELNKSNKISFIPHCVKIFLHK